MFGAYGLKMTLCDPALSSNTLITSRLITTIGCVCVLEAVVNFVMHTVVNVVMHAVVNVVRHTGVNVVMHTVVNVVIHTVVNVVRQ